MAPPKNRRPGFSKRAQYSIFASYLLGILGAVVALLLLLISFVDPQRILGSAELSVQKQRHLSAKLLTELEFRYRQYSGMRLPPISTLLQKTLICSVNWNKVELKFLKREHSNRKTSA